MIKQLLIFTYFTVFLLGCQQKTTLTTQSLTQSDLAALAQRQNRVDQLYYVMPHMLALFVSVPSVQVAPESVFLQQAATVRLLDSTVYISDNGVEYRYVEDALTKAKGYVASDYIIDASYTLGLTLAHGVHYFQPDETLGQSNSIALPSYSLIFSNDAALKNAVLPEFITYHAVDPQGFPLEGYLKSHVVSFDPNTLNAYRLYQQAFYSADFDQQRDLAQKLQTLYPRSVFEPMMDALLNLRNLTYFDELPSLFDRLYQAKRRRHLGHHLTPLYAEPNDQSLVLGYVVDDRLLPLVAGYQFNELLEDVQSPYRWYLVQQQGWILANNIEIMESLNEAHRLLEGGVEVELDYLLADLLAISDEDDFLRVDGE